MNEAKKSRGRPRKTNPQTTTIYGNTESKPEYEKTESEQLNDLKSDFASVIEETVNTEKKSSNYKSKKAQLAEEEESAKQFANSVSGIGSIVIDLFFERAGYEKLRPEESEKLNTTFNAVLMKYVKFAGSYQEETALALVGVMILIPRVTAPKKLKEKNESDSKA